MKSARDLESELMSLRSSLKKPQRHQASLTELGIEWLKDEVDRTLPPELHGKLGKWRDRTEEMVSAHPIATAAIALCVGLALGQLWRRHHDQ